MTVTKHPPHLIRSHAFRICEGLAACESHFAMAERQDDGSYTVAYYVDVPMGRDRVVEKEGLDTVTAIKHLYEWETEMSEAGYPRSAIRHFRSLHYADACRELEIPHPEQKRRSEQHARRVKKTYIDRRKQPGMQP